MRTVKELQKSFNEIGYTAEHHAYYEGYRHAIEGILSDITESQAISVTSIEEYLNNLLNK